MCCGTKGWRKKYSNAGKFNTEHPIAYLHLALYCIHMCHSLILPDDKSDSPDKLEHSTCLPQAPPAASLQYFKTLEDSALTSGSDYKLTDDYLLDFQVCLLKVILVFRSPNEVEV